jgi:hypothetical protein
VRDSYDGDNFSYVVCIEIFKSLKITKNISISIYGNLICMFLLHDYFMHTSVACGIGPSVNPLQNRETQHVNIVLQCMY